MNRRQIAVMWVGVALIVLRYFFFYDVASPWATGNWRSDEWRQFVTWSLVVGLVVGALIYSVRDRKNKEQRERMNLPRGFRRLILVIAPICAVLGGGLCGLDIENLVVRDPLRIVIGAIIGYCVLWIAYCVAWPISMVFKWVAAGFRPVDSAEAQGKGECNTEGLSSGR